MNNIDMNQLLSAIGKMDKKDLEAAMQKANEIMGKGNNQRNQGNQGRQ